MMIPYEYLGYKLMWYLSVCRPKMVVLGSRAQLCIHDEVKLLRGKTQTNACRLLCRRRGKRHCNHFKKVPGNFVKIFHAYNMGAYILCVDLVWHYASCISNSYLTLSMYLFEWMNVLIYVLWSLLVPCNAIIQMMN